MNLKVSGDADLTVGYLLGLIVLFFFFITSHETAHASIDMAYGCPNEIVVINFKTFAGETKCADSDFVRPSEDIHYQMWVEILSGIFLPVLVALYTMYYLSILARVKY